MKVVSQYNTVSTANACTHQKQQIFENNFFFTSGRSKIMVKSPNKTTLLLTTSGYVL